MTAKCDIWEGARNSAGYGHLWLGDRTYYAHRIVWAQEHGAIPEGLVVMHSCDVPSCINIEHLSIGTVRDNARDAVAKGRLGNQRKTECPQGHAYTPENTKLDRGWRYCRECDRVSSLRRYHAKRLEAVNA